MKKVLVTGTFEGAVELVYGEEGQGMGVEYYAPLLSVEFGQAVLKDEQKAWFMGRIPVRMGPVQISETESVGFEHWFTTKLKVIVEDVELDFERDFWTPYGKKLNKDRCIKKWDKMTKADRALACVRLHAYLRYLSRTGYGKADPENYLEKKYFKNDYDKLNV